MSSIVDPFAGSRVAEKGLCPFMSGPMLVPDGSGRPAVSHVASGCTPNCALYNADQEKCTFLTLASGLDLLPEAMKAAVGEKVGGIDGRTC